MIQPIAKTTAKKKFPYQYFGFRIDVYKRQAMFKLLGDKFCHLHEEFVRQGNYSFSLPSDLQEQFIEYLSRVNERCV